MRYGGNIKVRAFQIGIALSMLVTGVWAISPTWQYFYNGPANGVDISNVVLKGSDGNLYIAGASMSRQDDPSSYDVVVLSLTLDGSFRWLYRYNGPIDGEDGAYDMVEGPDGNLYITGIVSTNTYYDLLVLSLTKTGQLRWIYTYDGVAHGHDIGDAITVDNTSNIYVGGMSSRQGLNDNYDWVVLSLTPEGNLRWMDVYNGPGNYHDRTYDITYGSDGNIYATGYRVTSGNYADFMVVKYTVNGTREWIRTVDPDGLHDMAYATIFGSDGNIYVAGRLQTYSSNWDFAIVSYTRDGTQRWIYRYQPGYGQAFDLIYGVDGKIYAAGNAEYRFTVVALENSGNEECVYQYDPMGHHFGRATGILQNEDGTLYAFGGERLQDEAYSHPTLVKLENNGSPIYEERFPNYLIYTIKPREYMDITSIDYPTFYLTAGVSNTGTTGDIEFGIEEWEMDGQIVTYDAFQESADHDIWVARFDDISVTLPWPNEPGIVLEEGDTTYVRFDGIAGLGIQRVESWFSPDGGETWPHYIGPKDYSWPYPTIVYDDSIRWVVDTPPTNQGRVKAILFDAENDSVLTSPTMTSR